MKKSYSLSVCVIFIISLCWLIFQFKYKVWITDKGIIDSDVIFYYEYLPAVFIYHDISLSFLESLPFEYKKKMWGNSMQDDKHLIRMTMGLSFLYLPFFLVALLYEKSIGHNPVFFSDSFEIALSMSSLFFSITGLIYLRKILLLYFREFIVGLLLLVIGIGTNLLNYTTLEACMSHAYLFCMINIFIWNLLKWNRSPTIGNILVPGVLIGIISLIRPTQALILLLFIFFSISDWADISNRIKFLLNKKLQIIIMLFVGFIVWLPQICYWKYVTGHWMFFSYIGERFFFDKPHIIAGLFSYRKGWLLYTPLMAFSLVGFFQMRRRIPELFTGTLIYFILSIYIIFSWWCWWYGGSFGQRSLIDMYGLLALPMGCLFEFIYRKKIWKRIGFTFLIFCLIAFQLFQNYQYYTGAIHWANMTKEAYWASFLKTSPPPGWNYLLKVPDYEGARLYGKEK
jgi:hypothetical protein